MNGVQMGTVDNPPPLARSIFRIVVQITVIVAIAYGVHLLTDWVIAKSETLSDNKQSVMLTSILALVLLAYAILIAVPFVPGIEIGLTLILMRGAPIAPYVYFATVLGLIIAYLIGRYMPYTWLARLLLDLRLKRASTLVVRVQELSPDERMTLLRERLPSWLGKHCVSWRYAILALLINIPGTALIGGGGGIALIAGLSRLFTPVFTIVTIALAVSPVPILVWYFGIELIK